MISAKSKFLSSIDALLVALGVGEQDAQKRRREPNPKSLKVIFFSHLYHSPLLPIRHNSSVPDAPLNSLIAFFRDCLRDERDRSGISNLFANKIIRRRFISGEEKVTTHEFASLDLPPLTKDQITRIALLRSRDTDLFYTALPIVGKIEDRTIAAPLLLLYPVQLLNEDFQIQLDEVWINPAITTLFSLPPSKNSSRSSPTESSAPFRPLFWPRN